MATQSHCTATPSMNKQPLRAATFSLRFCLYLLVRRFPTRHSRTSSPATLIMTCPGLTSLCRAMLNTTPLVRLTTGRRGQSGSSISTISPSTVPFSTMSPRRTFHATIPTLSAWVGKNKFISSGAPFLLKNIKRFDSEIINTSFRLMRALPPPYQPLRAVRRLGEPQELAQELSPLRSLSSAGIDR
jgi:hypothetical protein